MNWGKLARLIPLLAGPAFFFVGSIFKIFPLTVMGLFLTVGVIFFVLAEEWWRK